MRGGSGNVYANCQPSLLGKTGNHVTLIVDPVNSVSCFYNGASLVSGLNFDTAIVVPSLAGINDVYNWIGRSLHSIDPYLAGTIHEFRIYEGVLPVQAIALNDAVGPDHYIELSANPKLSASHNGGNVVLSWPASNYGFSVQSRPSLSVGSSWTTLTNSPALVGTNWQVSLPATNTARFYQLVH